MTRGARLSVDPTEPLQLKLPQTLLARLTLHLFSDLEGRVPKGKYKEFFCERIREYFEWRRVDLTPYGFPPGYFISGPKEMVEEVERRLQHETR